jgi:hypothetical protein
VFALTLTVSVDELVRVLNEDSKAAENVGNDGHAGTLLELAEAIRRCPPTLHWFGYDTHDGTRKEFRLLHGDERIFR